MCSKNEDKGKMICIKTGKTCFSKKEAGNCIRRFKTRRRKNLSRQKQIPLRSYYCDYCGTYHLSHSKQFFCTKK